MKTVSINLYSFSELSKDSQHKAIEKHSDFLNDDSELDSPGFSESDVIENIEANEYLFFNDGSLASCITYTGKHPKAGITEFKFKGSTYPL